MSPTPPRPTGLESPDRLADLGSSALMDSPVEEAFERCTRLVTTALGVPVALVSLVDDRRQFFKSATGLEEPWASRRGTALSHSLCQHVVTADAPLVVSDARTDPRVSGSGAVTDLAVVAYAGAPVHGPGGLPIGALCAIDHQPRQWTESEVSLLEDLADATSELIAMRAAAVQRRAAVAELSHQVRTGLTALQLEAAGLEHAAGGDPGHAAGGDEVLRVQAARVVEAVQAQTEALGDALRSASAGELGHEQQVDLAALVTETARRHRPDATSSGRELVVSDLPAGDDVAAPVAELSAVLDGLVSTLLEHGRGRLTLGLVRDAATTRVRVQDESQGLPTAVSAALAGRLDSASSGAALSLAERAARSFGGRLVQTSSRPTTIDLVLPRSRPSGDRTAAPA